MSGGGTATGRLERALTAHAARCGLALSIDDNRATRWASATFVGARHRLEMTLGGEISAGQDWIAGLPEADLPLPGHLVADLIVIGRRTGDAGLTATIEVLTVED
ncbi:hypothetical protein ACFSC3_09325 [Sphingomonas floccifaciens]|uniref:RecJ OB domain-containing protein n=1 Tax=Sphingomonas floccifaciens TaxID=1844115 RepID=A0ABW4NCN7_9SPHN